MDKKVLNHFKKTDPILYQEIQKVLRVLGPGGLEKGRNTEGLFGDLCRSIINQQLSNKAAATIFQRFKDLFPKGEIAPKYLLKLKPEVLRKAGMSYPKINYLQDLAQKVSSGEVDLENIDKLSNEEVIEKLVSIKGIGRWTAEMFLMFALDREDLFSHGDLILRKSVIKLYNLGEKATQEEIELVVSKWSPYKSLACRILWRSSKL